MLTLNILWSSKKYTTKEFYLSINYATLVSDNLLRLGHNLLERTKKGKVIMKTDKRIEYEKATIKWININKLQIKSILLFDENRTKNKLNLIIFYLETNSKNLQEQLKIKWINWNFANLKPIKNQNQSKTCFQ